MRKGKIRWGAVANGLAGLLAVASLPEVAGLLSRPVAALIAAATLINATFIKPAVRSEEDRDASRGKRSVP